jgi:pimeloyl-ACP methyl ester carboxylesterase
MRRVAATVVAGALLASGCSVLSGSSAGPLPLASGSAIVSAPSAGTTIVDARSDPAAAAGALTFTDVTKKVRSALSGGGSKVSKLSFAEGVLTVPLDWSHAGNGQTVGISVVRIRSSKQHDRIGSLLVNPGGPGVSGIDYALDAAVSEIPEAILDRFDIIGFDPRGIGASSPLSCIPSAEKDAELNEPAYPISDADWNAQVAETQKVADECYAKYGTTLTYYSTAETVRDMDALRARLGDQKLTYLGYSYGTLLGAEYASAYPSRVRALVLDGAVDPTLGTAASSLAQAGGFQLAFGDYAKACASEGSKCSIGPDADSFLTKLLAQADAHPIPTSTHHDDRVAKSGAVLLAVISALYDRKEWSTLTSALEDASDGDAAGVLSLDDEYNERASNGSYSNVEEANDAIDCADTADRPTVAAARAVQPQWAKVDPLLGASQASVLYSCSLWKAPADTPITVADRGAPTVLVVGTTGDPATPISGARHLTSLLGTAHLLIWDGEGHTAYPKTTCVTTTVDNYLINLTAPVSGTTCPAS